MLRLVLSLTFLLTIALAGFGCDSDDPLTLCEENGVSVSIADNHPTGDHALEIPASDVVAAVQEVYDIQGDNTGHGHTVTVTANDFIALGNGSLVTLTSSDTGAAGMDHTHVVSLDCNP